MTHGRIVRVGSSPDPDKEFWVVQNTDPSDEWMGIFEVDAGTPPRRVRELYLEQAVPDPDVRARYDDDLEAYYLRLDGPYRGAPAADDAPTAPGAPPAGGRWPPRDPNVADLKRRLT